MLTELPQELLLEIISYLCYEEYYALRLTSRRMHSAVGLYLNSFATDHVLPKTTRICLFYREHWPNIIINKDYIYGKVSIVAFYLDFLDCDESIFYHLGTINGKQELHIIHILMVVLSHYRNISIYNEKYNKYVRTQKYVFAAIKYMFDNDINIASDLAKFGIGQPAPFDEIFAEVLKDSNIFIKFLRMIENDLKQPYNFLHYLYNKFANYEPHCQLLDEKMRKLYTD